MSTFDPVTIFYILYETMGAWLWVLLATALALLAGILSAVVKFRRARCPAARPLWIAVAVGLIAAVGLTFAVPIWSLADPGALSGLVDYVVAFSIALVPGAIVAALVFIVVARRCNAPIAS
jgi:hypothetical protein